MDASTIERDVLEQLLRVAECDAAAIVRLGAPEHARIPLVDALIVGDATITERSTRLIREGGEWRPLAFARRHADSERLLSLADVARLMGPETFRTSWAEASSRHGIHDQLRIMIFDGTRAVAWFGALSTVHPAFDARIVRRANALLPSLVPRIRLADKIRRAKTPSEVGDVLVASNGAVQHASRVGRQWLDAPEFADSLRAMVHAADSGVPESVVAYAHGARVRLVRCDGSTGTLYLGHIEPIAPLECPPVTLLTDAQLGVARFAASGATISEIAMTLKIAPGTVRVHLRAVYERLGIANRVELARALVGFEE